MSRLDKQLDEISGEQMVKVIWPSDADVDTDAMRSQLIREIDAHRERIPLDLREVEGAPDELVELIHDMRRYALSKSKVLSTSRILPPLRKALEARARRPLGRSVAPSSSDKSGQTSDFVNDLLKESQKKYDLSTAEKIERKKKSKKPKAPDRYRYWKLGGVVLLATLLVAAAEAYYVLVVDNETPVIMPEKNYESR